MLSGPCVGREVGKSLVATKQVNAGGWLVHSQTTVGSYGTRKVFPVHRPSILQCVMVGAGPVWPFSMSAVAVLEFKKVC
jgi:hypothetical protein